MLAVSMASPIQAAPAARPAAQEAGKDPFTQLQRFNEFFRYLSRYYVDTVDNVQVVDDAIRGALSALDPHSSFVSAEDMVSVRESMEGKFGGIGIEFNVMNDTILVVNVIPDGPSDKVGLQPNDRIVEVDGKSAIGTTRAGVPKLLRGPKGSVVTLTVMRRGVANTLTFRIKRDNIPIHSVDAAYMVEPGIAYIRVNQFAVNTLDEFEKAFDKLDKESKVVTLILDLRGNGGGLLDQAIKMSGFFIDKGSLVVSTEGRAVPPERLMAQGPARFTKGNLIILIDESSASASEIVAGAVQDWDRGVLIGTRTFGKGLVQRQFPLTGGSAVRVTVSRYHTPSGRAIQRPFEQGNREGYYKALNDRVKKGAADSIAGSDSLKYKTLSKGRTVYGGGGIYPDIYVSRDTTGITPYAVSLMRSGKLFDFLISYIDKNRKSLLSTYPTPAAFISKYNVGDDIIDSIVKFAEKGGVKCPEGEPAKASDYLKVRFKAMVAHKLWSYNEYFMIINAQRDAVFGRAVEAAKDWDKTSKLLDTPR